MAVSGSLLLCHAAPGAPRRLCGDRRCRLTESRRRLLWLPGAGCRWGDGCCGCPRTAIPRRVPGGSCDLRSYPPVTPPLGQTRGWGVLEHGLRSLACC